MLHAILCDTRRVEYHTSTGDIYVGYEDTGIQRYGDMWDTGIGIRHHRNKGYMIMETVIVHCMNIRSGYGDT